MYSFEKYYKIVFDLLSVADVDRRHRKMHVFSYFQNNLINHFWLTRKRKIDVGVD